MFVVVVVLATIESAHAADVARTPTRPIAAAIATAGTRYGQPFQLSKPLRASTRRSCAEKALIGSAVGFGAGGVFGALTLAEDRGKGAALGALGFGIVSGLAVLKACRP